jgi:single-strand DNA-binding protein
MILEISAIGNLGRDASLQTSNGKTVINFTVAHTEKYKNAQDVVVEKTTWLECSMWEKPNIAPYLKQGTLVYLTGTPQTHAYLSKEGELRSSLRVTVRDLKLLSSKKEGTATVATTQQPQATSVANDGVVDDLPF